ncbi:hypothetical protein BHM03_00018630 [Ensete ventricosum]|nr:hypothetical protein BHM03_00018630 [Ensete ventricosum]
MGSTGEPERKRRHFSSISPTSAGATTKKQPLAPCSEDKKVRSLCFVDFLASVLRSVPADLLMFLWYAIESSRQLQKIAKDLEVEKDSFIWREKEVKLKVELADIVRRVAAFSGSRIVELEQILQKLADERVLLEIKLEEAAREPKSKDNEYKAWALVHSLKSSLDEHNLESNVKAAIEAEAISQKRLTSAEAEIDELRLKLERCDR